MKEHNNIDELLNSFIDDELTERQRTEVQRLISHDTQIVERLAELENCKKLVSSLPCEEPPADMLDRIKLSLERRTLLGSGESSEQTKGARDLFVRKLVAAAAVIVLFAVLGGLIYNIVAPENVSDKRVAFEGWKQPAEKIIIETPEPTIAIAQSEKTTLEVADAATAPGSRLELKTTVPFAINTFIRRAIERNNLSENVSQSRSKGKNTYAVSCSRQDLSFLLADLRSVWNSVDSATLFIENQNLAESVVVDAVTTRQIEEIANLDNIEERVALTKNFAVANTLPPETVLASADTEKTDLQAIPKTIPKPRLTSGHERTTETANDTENQTPVNLTIVVTDRYF